MEQILQIVGPAIALAGLIIGVWKYFDGRTTQRRDAAARQLEIHRQELNGWTEKVVPLLSDAVDLRLADNVDTDDFVERRRHIRHELNTLCDQGDILIGSFGAPAALTVTKKLKAITNGTMANAEFLPPAEMGGARFKQAETLRAEIRAFKTLVSEALSALNEKHLGK